MRLISIFFVTFAMLLGCYNVSEYSGDGKLIDKGSKASTDRYVLNLGAVYFDKQDSKIYQLVNLPETSFVVGFEVDFTKEVHSVLKSNSFNPTILLELTDSGGKVVFSKQSRFSSWTWSMDVNEFKAFIYGREEAETYFTPRPQFRYSLTITVIQPLIKKIEYSAQLLAKSGGWK